MPELAYLNGAFLPISEARVSIEDRGFQFADGVYEVIAFHADEPVLLSEHLERLARSCREIRLDLDPQQPSLESLIREGVRRAGFDHTLAYIQLTRGCAPRDHLFPEAPTPTVAMTFKPMQEIPAEKRQRGVAVMTVSDYRWHRCDVKSIALVANVLAKNEAVAHGFDDVIFVGPDGEVREASSANVFAISGGRLLTPPQDESILPGITRGLVLRWARETDLPVTESKLLLKDLKRADEVFLSSTTVDVLPVVRVDDSTIADGRPGPRTQALYENCRNKRPKPKT